MSISSDVVGCREAPVALLQFARVPARQHHRLEIDAGQVLVGGETNQGP